ncbi:MAG: hypothetical protein QM831_43985 [Kofleriaceae bacterium]
MDTSQQLGRTKAEFSPSEEWRRAFEKQATRATLDKLNRIARARLAVYKGGYEHVAPSDVDEVVIGALGDTWLGVLAWDHNRRELFSHLKDAIAYRVRDEAQLHRSQLADAFAEDEGGRALAEQLAPGGVVPTIANPDAREARLAPLVDKTLARLRQLSKGDRGVLWLLDKLAQRVVARDELLSGTEMSVADFNNIWRRLGRLVQQLPAHERDLALAALS